MSATYVSHSRRVHSIENSRMRRQLNHLNANWRTRSDKVDGAGEHKGDLKELDIVGLEVLN